MEISDKDLKDFKEIFEEEFGQKFLDSEARDMAERLIGFLMLIGRPLPDGKEPEEENPDINF